MAFSLACDASKTTLRIKGIDNDVTFNDIANAGAGSVAVDGVIVTGAGTPAAVNSPPPYEEYGTYNSKPYYRQLDGAHFIWWDGGAVWYISIVLGELGSGVFYREDPSVLGVYAATGAFSGTPTVALDTEDPSFFVTEHIANAVYQILKNVQFGDGIYSLTFKSLNEMVYFADGKIFEIKSNAILQLGELQGDWGKNGSMWSVGPSAEKNLIASEATIAKFYCFSSKLHLRTAQIINFRDGDVDVRNSILSGIYEGSQTSRYQFYGTIQSLKLNRVYFSNLDTVGLYKTPDVFSNVHTHYLKWGILIKEDVTAEDLLLTSYVDNDIFNNAAITALIKNPEVNIAAPKIGNAAGIIKEQYTCDIHVVDKDGNNLEGVTVTCEDKDSNQIFSVQTGADGKIAQQTITYKKWEGAAETETEYSPHKFTFSKNGYTLLVMENITVDARINWDVEVKFPERIRARMANLSRLAILR